jgi:phosphoglycerate dehydrogenase-like enzyme
MTLEHDHAGAAGDDLPPSSLARPWGLLAMRPKHLAAALYGPGQREELRSLVRVDHDLVVDDFHTLPAEVLERTEVLLSGWNPPPISEGVLERMPNLHFVAHAGGGVPGLELFEERGITAVSQAAANAIPTAEYSVAMILLANISAFRAQRLYRQERAYIDRERRFLDSGNYESRIGILGAGHVGRTVLSLLQSHELDLMVVDPGLSAEQIAQLGARKVELLELLTTSDVISVHVPDAPATHHLLGAAELAHLRDGATLVNSARGRVIDQEALVAELATGRIDAILDVTEPEVLAPGHPLHDLPNVVLTPHIAGSMGRELHRLADHSIRALRSHLRDRAGVSRGPTGALMPTGHP